ncbi:GAF and ANTAR domain-containing protein [Arthrobacter sp. ISL-28]|uniref:GAF and ANTAR domain-containing protein n=1 Tax=Arthrobacter sp. ISL-28 TaxID=2819108 RepID=UPI001BE90FD3|nr:GAF and ANTAR domain-containing protein [Arthrobacter sp. ISL-28]MBT2523199.1 GAF and ANTAR domain-containing protein [Arthrobacter sp. ISL-28]
MPSEDQSDDFERLHGLISGTEDLKGFLDGMTGFAAEMMTRGTGSRIECAVTLHRRKRSVTIAGSSDDAVFLDGIEQSLGEGPCVEALKAGHTIVLGDASTETRWTTYAQNLLAAGCRSAMGVPLELGSQADAVLNFFAPTTGLFDDEAVKNADIFADMASQALRLAIRIATADQLAENLRAAMENRTAIDLACGMIMAENRCGQEQAMEFLKKASSDRNEKLHAIAAQIIARVSRENVPATYFED